MGVPVLTLALDHHAGRVGKTLLEAAGLVDWVGYSAEEFVKKAVQKSADLEQLEKCRGSLRSVLSHSPLCNRACFMHDLEAAYRSIWSHWCGQRSDVIA